MKNFSLLIILLVTIPAIGQNGYYISDSTRNVGVNTVNMGISNTYYCTLKKGDKIIKYTPFEVSEYGLRFHQAYKAFDIIIDGKKESYFFLNAVKGNINLYQLKLKGEKRKYFVLPADSGNLQELTLKRTKLRESISGFTGNCQQAAKDIHLLKPNRYSLIRYMKYLNSCSRGTFPRTQFGFKIGIAATQFYPVDKNSKFASANYNSDISLTFGIFTSMPILSSNLSFSPGISFKVNHYARSYTSSSEGSDLVLNYSSFTIPVLLRYSFLREGNIPYIQLGPVYSRIVKSKEAFYQYEMTGNETYIQFDDAVIIQKNLGGVELGSGIIFNSKKNLKFFGELHYQYLTNLFSDSKNFNLGEISIHAGILL